MSETPYRREPGYAERYRDRRFREGHGPRTDARERRALHCLLERARTAGALHDGPWLDVPAGTGRMSGELPGRVVLADRDAAMLRAADPALPRVAASAAALPFATGAFAGVLCCRLLQHIADPDERRRILAELRRVTRGPVVVSFFDAASLLGLRRRVRRAFGKPRSGRGAIARSVLVADARAAGLRAVAFAALQRFVAEQTFVLLLPAGP